MEDVSLGACGTVAVEYEFCGGSQDSVSAAATTPTRNGPVAAIRAAGKKRRKPASRGNDAVNRDATQLVETLAGNGRAAPRSADIVAVSNGCSVSPESGGNGTDTEECTAALEGELSFFQAPTMSFEPELPSLGSRNAGADEAAAASPDADIAPLVEALLFSSDSPLTARKIAELAGAAPPAAVQRAITELNQRYRDANLTFRIEKIAEGYQMLTLPAYQPWVMKLDKHRADHRLSDAALETLAIVAYRQPIIRADAEAIRGVACGEMLTRLRELGLVRIAGRAEVVGRPLLYGTTKKFLDMFGLAGLEELPPMESLRQRAAEESQPA